MMRIKKSRYEWCEHCGYCGDIMGRRIIITEPSAVKALKSIYEDSVSPGILKWDFSVAGQVRAKGRLRVDWDGTLIGLSLRLTQISDLSPLAKLTKLAYLNLDQNCFSDITPLAGLTELVHLSLFENMISDLSPLAGMTKLTYLDLTGNRIKDISPLTGLTELTHLCLHFNPIKDLSPLAGMAKLTYIDEEELSVIGESDDGFDIGECEGMRVRMFREVKPPAHVSFSTAGGDCYYSIFGKFLKGVELSQDMDDKVRDWLKMNEGALAARWGRCLMGRPLDTL